MPLGTYYAINGVVVTSPDEEVWPIISLGDTLAGDQRRSPYRVLEWRKQVSGPCSLDWFDYDNTILTSLACTPPNSLNEFQMYTDAICQEVTMSKRHGVANEIVARFLVRAA